VSIRVAMHVWW